jgi:hypothetical protein
MRTFVKHNKAGDILSICRTEFVPEEMETPFGVLQKGEFVLEIKESDAMNKMAAEEIHESHKVDTAKKKLIKKR